jgi:MFS family permease
LCRVIGGIGVGGSIPAVFTLYTEYLPPKGRGMLLSIVASFWTVGTVYTAGTFYGRDLPPPKTTGTCAELLQLRHDS